MVLRNPSQTFFSSDAVMLNIEIVQGKFSGYLFHLLGCPGQMEGIVPDSSADYAKPNENKDQQGDNLCSIAAALGPTPSFGFVLCHMHPPHCCFAARSVEP